MRPLICPQLPQHLRGRYPAASLLMSAFGHFCSFCERPLLDEAWVWNARTGYCLEQNSFDTEDWSHLYLLDYNCHLAHQEKSELAPQALLLPTAAGVFSPRFEQALSYSMRPLTRVLLDDRQLPVGRELVPSVVITGHTAAARATIDYFQLNTRYYDESGQKLRVPLQDHLALADRRLEQRTQAWIDSAEFAVRVLRAFSFSMGPVVIEQFRLVAGLTGFWSSSATAAATVLHSQRILRRIFFEATEPAGSDILIAGLKPAEAADFHGNGGYHTFPGSRNVFD